MSSWNTNARNNDRKKNQRESPQAISPAVYPQQIPTGYPMPPPQWMHPGYQCPPYYQPWNVQQQFPGMSSSWMQGSSMDKPPIPSSNNTRLESDELMVSALSRIYGTNDGSIEIERVKVQRKATCFGSEAKLPQVEYPGMPSETNVTRAIPGDLYVKRPPPRKNKKRSSKIRDAHIDPSTNIDREAIPQWYPYAPYATQPYTYPPYPYGYMWPSSPPTALECQSLTDESESSCSRHELQHSLPGSSGSQHLDSGNNEKSLSSDHHRSNSSAANSHLTESQATDIAPSDSVSMGGYRRKKSVENVLAGSNRSSYGTSAGSILSSDGEKTEEWMHNMRKILASKIETQSVQTPDRTSFMTAHSEIPTPNTNTSKSSTPPKLRHIRSNSESNIVLADTIRNNTSPPLLSNTRVSDSDLLYAFKKLENSGDTFKSHAKYNNGRVSRSSTLSFHSTRQSADEDVIVDTDSTDIALPTDSPLGSNDTFHSNTFRKRKDDIDYKWILQSSDKKKQNEDQETGEELKNDWRAEVSLWRAHLVVSLCKGQGLDQDDWDTFQLLIQHPLSMDKKLTLLHPQRICSLNRELGVVFLRNALLHLTTYGEALLKPEDIRPIGWKSIPYDGNQLWYAVKGAIEILYVFGYRLMENGLLKHRRKYAPDISVLARLTLDILVLTEELRLYLTGAHRYSINISQIFSPLESDENLVDKDSADQTESTVFKNRRNISDKPISSVNDISTLNEQIATNPPTATEPDLTNFDSESIATVSSLPDLQSISPTKIFLRQDSESSGSLTPTVKSENYKTDDVISQKKVVHPSVEHVYEEINEIKVQVQELKDNEKKTQNKPPPLPPKQRSITESTENPYSDAYSQVDWSINSQCSSSQGEFTAPRRRKRKAPMPPKRAVKYHGASSQIDTSSEWFSKQTAIKEQIFKSTNPFYEDLEPVGHVGRNPFYETISIKRNDDKSFPVLAPVSSKKEDHGNQLCTNQIKTTNNSLEVENNSNLVGNNKGHKFTEEQSLSFDENTFTEEDNSVTTAIRPNRKKKKRQAPITVSNSENIEKSSNVSSISVELARNNINDDQNDTVILLQSSTNCEGTESCSIEENNQEAPDTPVIISAKKTQAQLLGTNLELEQPRNEATTSKNEVGEPQYHSHIVVPSNEKKPESPNMSKNHDVLVQKIVISYDICLKKPETATSPIPKEMSVYLNTEDLLDIKINNEDDHLNKPNIDLNLSSPEHIQTEDNGQKKEVIGIFDADGIAFIDSDGDEEEEVKCKSDSQSDANKAKPIFKAQCIDTDHKDTLPIFLRTIEHYEGKLLEQAHHDKLTCSSTEKIINNCSSSSVSKDDSSSLCFVETSSATKEAHSFKDEASQNNSMSQPILLDQAIVNIFPEQSATIDNQEMKTEISANVNMTSNQIVTSTKQLLENFSQKSDSDVGSHTNKTDLEPNISSQDKLQSIEKLRKKSEDTATSEPDFSKNSPYSKYLHVANTKSQIESDMKPSETQPSPPPPPKEPPPQFDAIIFHPIESETKNLLLDEAKGLKTNEVEDTKLNITAYLKDDSKPNISLDLNEDPKLNIALNLKDDPENLELIRTTDIQEVPKPNAITILKENLKLSIATDLKEDINENDRTDTIDYPKTEDRTICKDNDIQEDIELRKISHCNKDPIVNKIYDVHQHSKQNIILNSNEEAKLNIASNLVEDSKLFKYVHINDGPKTKDEIDIFKKESITDRNETSEVNINERNESLKETLSKGNESSKETLTDGNDILIEIVKGGNESLKETITEENESSEKTLTEENEILKETLIEGNKFQKENIPQKNEIIKETTIEVKETLKETDFQKGKFETVSNDIEEDRYEIPDVTRAQAIDNENKKRKQSETLSTQSADSIPVRPPRNRIKSKAPPLPPKSHLHLSPPALPPKGENVGLRMNSSFCSVSSINTSDSASAGLRHSEEKIDSHAISPSPLAIPSISPQAYTAPALVFASRAQPTQVTYMHSSSPDKKSPTIRSSSTVPSKQNDFYPSMIAPYKSTSMPSSPKSSTKLKIHQSSSKVRKERKSWPFQLCTCVSSKNTYDRVPYARK